MLSVGVDLGGTNIAAGLVNEKGRLLCKLSLPTRAERAADEIADDIAILCGRLRARAEELSQRVIYVGLGCPGTIDSEKGVVVYANNIHMKNTPLKVMLERRVHLPVIVENDANTAALGEYFINGRGAKSFVLITLGTGVGGGVIIDGKIYKGFNCAGGELGHIIINIDGEPCSCGNRGCWEAYASAAALIRQTKKAMAENKDSLMISFAEKRGAVNGKTAFECAKLGDKAAERVVENYIKYVGTGLVSVLNIFQPEILLIGGGISCQGENLLKPLREFVYKYDYNKYMKKTKIEAASLLNSAGIIGAGILGSC